MRVLTTLLSISSVLAASVGHAETASIVRSRFFGVLNETAFARTVDYTSNTCLIDSVTGQPSRRVAVTIVKADNKSIRTQSDDAGCITWVDSISHTFYSGKRYIEVPYTIIVGNDTMKVKTLVNPWDDSFTFGLDERELTDSKIERLKSFVGPQPVLSVSQFRLIRYVNQNDGLLIGLSIKTAVTGHEDIIHRDHPVTRPEVVRDGDYKIKLQVRDENQNILGEQVVTATVTEGTANVELLISKRSKAKNLVLNASFVPDQTDPSQSQFQSVVTQGSISSSDAGGWTDLK